MAEAVAAIDYLHHVRPKVTVSVHRKLLSAAGMSTHHGSSSSSSSSEREEPTLQVMKDGKPLKLYASICLGECRHLFTVTRLGCSSKPALGRIC
jgi:hypothetical protein